MHLVGCFYENSCNLRKENKMLQKNMRAISLDYQVL